MAIDMTQFYHVFFEESAEHLANMETLLLELDIANPDPEQLNAIFRAAHSIKGSAGTFGFTDLAGTTHILENLLDRIRKRELVLRPDMVDAFLETGDLLRVMLDSHQGRGSSNPVAVEAICERLRQLSSASGGPATSTAPGETLPISSGAAMPPIAVAESPDPRACLIEFVPTEISARAGGVANLLDDLHTMGELEILRQPAAGADGVGFWQLRLIAGVAEQTLADTIEFIADNGAWRICEDKSFTDGGEADYGFFEGSPGAPEGDGYGVLAPPNAPQTAADSSPEVNGYGLSEPIVPVAPGAASGAQNVPVSVPVVAQLASKAQGAKVASPIAVTGDSSIRVSIEKVDQLINLVGELVITQAMLLQTASRLEAQVPERLFNGLAQLERNTRDLQTSVMSIRMMPISFVFSRFPRVVRDLSGKLGKQVELKTLGEGTELDRGLIERIADPLTHLIRNSLDHGIELPEQRVAAGKSPVGTITLKASHEGGNVVIEVGDDGAGLPREKILAKARERGNAVSGQMSDPEIFNLIFEAGFSTADQVTDVSGRGVGMDVVRRNVQSMGGRVEIESTAGAGTRMTVRLPLTLAILDGMSVAVGDQIYILPLSYVIESMQPAPGDIKTLSNQARVIQVRGEYLPVVVLHEIFNLKPLASDFTQGIMVVIDADGIQAALFVDSLVGQHQVVIKSLEANYRKVTGISAATIMGDGHVALILDLSAIAGMAKSNVQKAG